MHVTFLSVRTETKLVIKMQNNGQVSYTCVDKHSLTLTEILQVTIQTDDMELAGNIIQSMGKFLNIDDLQTSGDFPQELETLQRVFTQVGFSPVKNGCSRRSTL